MRTFSLLTLLSIASSLFLSSSHAADSASAREYYELRVYTTKNAEQQKLIIDYWEKAAVPAYNQAGVRPIGVFTEMEESPTNKIYVLIPHPSLQSFGSINDTLAQNNAYQSAAASFMNRSKNDAPYVRLDTTLLAAMTEMPKLALPPSSADKSPWLFELRTYISPTEAKGANKVDMFNAGEVQIMKEIGVHPVFFAQTVAGPQMPNLIYMTSGTDREQYRDKWKAFGPHPTWKKLSADPKYKDNMTGIQSTFLKRTSASQI